MSADLISISIGLGVQSKTLHCMANEGLIDGGVRPHYSIFADPGWESQGTYEQLKELRTGTRIPIVTVTNGNIREMLVRPVGPRSRFASVPFFLDDGSGVRGMGRRQCTHEYKIRPIEKKLRELLGKTPRQRIRAGAVEQWIGISLDEAHRMKPSRSKWIVNRWPLVEMRMTRHDCLMWLTKHGYSIPPKSSCIGCPFHGNSTWASMKQSDPVAWADAVDVDKIIRSGGTQNEVGKFGKQYMHGSLQPLDEVDLRTAADHGQGDLFGNECEGMCGV